jgi:hypothetical protein
MLTMDEMKKRRARIEMALKTSSLIGFRHWIAGMCAEDLKTLRAALWKKYGEIASRACRSRIETVDNRIRELGG